MRCTSSWTHAGTSLHCRQSIHNPTVFPPESRGNFKIKWSFYLAYHLTDRGTWFFPTQRIVSRCSVSSLWMATPTITISMCMRQDVQRGACTKLPTRWFPTIHHNEIRDITAHLVSDVCHNVGIEPPLQHTMSETMSYTTANVKEGAHLDIKAQGIWGNDTGF